MTEPLNPTRFENPDHALGALIGDTDIYLVDQILRGRFPPGATVLDAGSGSGRNLRFFLHRGDPVIAVDHDPSVVARTRSFAGATARPQRCVSAAARVEALPFSDATVDVVIANAVLHFATDANHFDAMVGELWRTLRPGGVFFARLASTIGIEGAVKPLGEGRFHLPDGTERYLVDEARLLEWTGRLQARLLDPLKTVNVQGQRAMTTWCLRKP